MHSTDDCTPILLAFTDDSTPILLPLYSHSTEDCTPILLAFSSSTIGTLISIYLGTNTANTTMHASKMATVTVVYALMKTADTHVTVIYAYLICIPKISQQSLCIGFRLG